MIADCPHCKTRVWIRTDGMCPTCRHDTASSAAWTAEKLEGETQRSSDSVSATTAEVAGGSELKSLVPTRSCPMCGTDVSIGATSCHNCAEAFGGAEAGIWRMGRNVLVMRKDALLPDRCIKTNQPAQGVRLRQKLTWISPAWFITCFVAGVATPLLILHFSLITFFVTCAISLVSVAFFLMQRTAVVHIGLTALQLARRKRALIMAWGLSLFGLALVFIGLASIVTYSTNFLLLIPVGLVLLILGFFFGGVIARTIAAKRITKDHVWLKGFHPDYLAELPEWEERRLWFL